MKTMTILGSTGSIGTQALEVAAKHNIKVKALAANSDVEKLAAQAKELMPERVCIYREDKKSELEKLLSGTGIKISTGMEGLKEIARMDGGRYHAQLSRWHGGSCANTYGYRKRH